MRIGLVRFGQAVLKNIKSLEEALKVEPHEHKFWLNEDAPRNIFPVNCTFAMFQLAKF